MTDRSDEGTSAAQDAVSRGLDAEFRRRFVTWHLGRVTELADCLGSEDQWYALLDADEPNLTVALRWAEEDRDTESLLLLGVGLWRYWQARGALTIGREWLERGLNASPTTTSSTRMLALWGLAWLAYQQGDDAAARACAEELAAWRGRHRIPSPGATSRRSRASLRSLEMTSPMPCGTSIAHSCSRATSTSGCWPRRF